MVISSVALSSSRSDGCHCNTARSARQMREQSEGKTMFLLIKKISGLTAIQLPEAELRAPLIYFVFFFFFKPLFKRCILNVRK